MRKLVFTLMFLVFAGVASANNNVEPINLDGDLELLRCQQKGGLELAQYWDAAIYSDNLKDGVLEPVFDITSRNQCQALDILILRKQQDKIREQIRDAVFKCKQEDLPRLQKAYNKIRVEIFYLRNVIDTSVALPVPFINRDLEDSYIKNRNELYTEMREKYISKGFFTPNEFDQFFIELEVKYNKDALRNYLQCSSGSWALVSEKWDEFMKFFTEEYGGLKEAGANIAAESVELGQAVMNTNLAKLLTNKDLEEFAGSFVTMRVNGIEPMQEFEAFIEELNETANVSGLDISSFNAEQSKRNYDYQNRQSVEEIAANFRFKYRNSADGIELTLNALDGRDSDEVQGLIETLDLSFADLVEIESKASVMNSRQCKTN